MTHLSSDAAAQQKTSSVGLHFMSKTLDNIMLKISANMYKSETKGNLTREWSVSKRNIEREDHHCHPHTSRMMIV